MARAAATPVLPSTPPAFAPDPLDGARLQIVLATISLNVVAVVAFLWVPGSGWRTAIGLNVVDNLLLVGFALIARDRMMWRLIFFGLLVGFLELPTDAWLVDVSRTLDYSPGGGPIWWRSPFWMPFAWEVVAVQFGYVGLRLYERIGWGGLVVTGLMGAVNIPFYEEMARYIHWWQYHDTPMFPRTHTPWAIIVGEFFIAAYLGYFATWTRRKGWTWATIAGVCGGASIFVGYALPYWAVLRWWPHRP